MSPSVSRHRPHLLDAAIELLADGGARALTHAAVDRRAGVPAGTTSNYHRTRLALLGAVLEHLVAKDREAVGALTAELGAARDAAAMLRLTLRMVDFLTGPGRALTLARYAVFLEAAQQPELAGRVAESAAAVRDLAVEALTTAGAASPRAAAERLLATVDGVVLARVAYGRELDVEAVLAPVVASVFDT